MHHSPKSPWKSRPRSCWERLASPSAGCRVVVLTAAVAAMTAAAALSPRTVLSQTAAAARAADGAGRSHWGLVPPPADSVRAVFAARSPAAWTYPLRVPYYAVVAPLGLAFDGVGAGVAALDESGVVAYLQRLLGPRTGPFGLTLNFQAGGLDGFGGGVTAYHDAFFGERNRFKARVFGSVNETVKTHVGWLFPRGEDSRFELGAGYRLRPRAQYFGLGPRATERDAAGDPQESHYTQETTWAGATHMQGLGGGFGLETRGLFSASGARDARGDDDDAAIQVVHPDDVARPGFGFRDRSDGVSLGATLVHDTVAEDGRPEGGGLRRLHVDYFTAVDRHDFSYWTMRAEAQQFLPLWFSRRSLALRGVLGWIEEESGTLPFQRLYTNDDPDLFRGYRDFRWRDMGLAALTVEYRWPVWADGAATGPGVDAYLLADFGQVFGEFDELALDLMTASYGGGLRLLGGGGFVGRLEVAASDEETVFRLKADQVFFYDKRGLYHGRNPIPLR